MLIILDISEILCDKISYLLQQTLTDCGIAKIGLFYHLYEIGSQLLRNYVMLIILDISYSLIRDLFVD